MDKKDIRNFTLEELRLELGKVSEPSYRAEQIFHWLYKAGEGDFDNMKNLPRAFRDKFKRLYPIEKIEVLERLESIDGVEKVLFRLSDGNCVETVLIPSGRRRTACLSTQVGCKYNCSFCASGKMGFKRNLAVSEILGQILFLQRELGHEITNFVFMGMGEPFDNYENVSKAISVMNSPKAMGIAARRITISTSGVIPGIKKLRELGLQVNLSVSLHASNNALRDKLMPINKKYPLEELVKACEGYISGGGRMITLEYILIKGVNDSKKDADGLASIARRLRAKINLISFSPVLGSGFKPPLKKDVEIFKEILDNRKINVTVRESKGRDIMAACGQLAGKS